MSNIIESIKANCVKPIVGVTIGIQTNNDWSDYGIFERRVANLAAFFEVDKSWIDCLARFNINFGYSNITLPPDKTPMLKAFADYWREREDVYRMKAHRDFGIRKIVCNFEEYRDSINRYLNENGFRIIQNIDFYYGRHGGAISPRFCGDSILFFDNDEVRLVCMKYGAYVRKFITEESVRVERYVKRFELAQLPPQFEIIHDSDQIVAAYLDSHAKCPSCMTYQLSEYSSRPHHPTAVYGGDSDLSLAVLKMAGEIVARALVNKTAKTYVRVYPSSGDNCERSLTMKKNLREAGFELADNFVGAKLRRLESQNGNVICPYIDGDQQGIKICKTHIEIVDDCDTSYLANQQNGLLEDNGEHCDSCGDSVDEDSYYSSPNGDGVYCESCYYERYGNCHECNEVFLRDNLLTAERNSYCETCFQDLFTSCDECGDVTRCDDSIMTKDDSHLCGSCHDNCEKCHDCGDVYHRDDRNLNRCGDDQLRCDDCQYDFEKELSFGLLDELGELKIESGFALGSLESIMLGVVEVTLS